MFYNNIQRIERLFFQDVMEGSLTRTGPKVKVKSATGPFPREYTAAIGVQKFSNKYHERLNVDMKKNSWIIKPYGLFLKSVSLLGLNL
jgi:hypothetical protein